jgi:hypothetical protein
VKPYLDNEEKMKPCQKYRSKDFCETIARAIAGNGQALLDAANKREGKHKNPTSPADRFLPPNPGTIPPEKETTTCIPPYCKPSK